ncbi:hypothetical protein ACLB2K_011356 [Fragaria x ananassa]
MGIGVSKLVNVISCFTNKEVKYHLLWLRMKISSNKEVIAPSSMADNQDLVREILSRLPVKSLVRVVCSPKSRDILRSNLTILYLHSCEGRHHHHKFSLLDRKVDKLSRVESPAFILDQSFEKIYIGGSDSGLVCLHLLGDAGTQLTEQIVVWNPVTKQYKKLPKPHLSLEGDKMLKMFKAAPLVGFGFIQDHGMDIDYKVVRISKCNDGRLATQVFTRSAKSWRVLKDYDLKCFGVIKASCITLNGVMYFLSWTCSWVYEGWRVFSFNLQHEVIDSISLPFPSDIHVSRISGSLFAWNNLVACSLWVDRHNPQYDVWVLAPESRDDHTQMPTSWNWTLQFTREMMLIGPEGG